MVQADWSGRIIDGRYAVESVIGAGGMGLVLKARHQFTGAEVAVKVLKSELAVDPEIQARFLAEARAPSAIGHPGIVSVLDAGKAPDGLLYLVMELLQGRPLRTAMSRGELGAADARRILLELLDTLGAAHTRRFVHRDLKPENVFLSGAQQQVKLLDFGIAKVLGSKITDVRTATNAQLGTPAYMAPEQFNDPSGVDPRADLWAVGIIAYEMLAGRLPFRADTPHAVLVAIAMNEFDPITKHLSNCPPAIAQFFERALARDRDHRFPTAIEMGLALGTLPLGNAPPPRPQRASQPVANLPAAPGSHTTATGYGTMATGAGGTMATGAGGTMATGAGYSTAYSETALPMMPPAGAAAPAAPSTQRGAAPAPAVHPGAAPGSAHHAAPAPAAHPGAAPASAHHAVPAPAAHPGAAPASAHYAVPAPNTGPVPRTGPFAHLTPPPTTHATDAPRRTSKRAWILGLGLATLVSASIVAVAVLSTRNRSASVEPRPGSGSAPSTPPTDAGVAVAATPTDAGSGPDPRETAIAVGLVPDRDRKKPPRDAGVAAAPADASVRTGRPDAREATPTKQDPAKPPKPDPAKPPKQDPPKEPDPPAAKVFTFEDQCRVGCEAAVKQCNNLPKARCMSECLARPKIRECLALPLGSCNEVAICTTRAVCGPQALQGSRSCAETASCELQSCSPGDFACCACKAQMSWQFAQALNALNACGINCGLNPECAAKNCVYQVSNCR